MIPRKLHPPVFGSASHVAANRGPKGVFLPRSQFDGSVPALSRGSIGNPDVASTSRVLAATRMPEPHHMFDPRLSALELVS